MLVPQPSKTVDDSSHAQQSIQNFLEAWRLADRKDAPSCFSNLCPICPIVKSYGVFSDRVWHGISLYYLGASGIHPHTRIGKHTLVQGKSSQRTTGILTQLVVPKCKPIAALKREVIRSCLSATGNHSRRFPNTVFVQMWEIALPWGDFPKNPLCQPSFWNNISLWEL